MGRHRTIRIVTAAEIAFASSPLATAVLAPDGVIRICNALFEQLLDLEAGMVFSEVLHANDRRAALELLETLREFPFGQLEARALKGQWLRLSAAPHVHADGTLEFVVLTAEDISAQRRSASELEIQFFFDPLTKLPNRAMLVQQMTVVMENLRRRGDALSLIFFDLDRFKLINDTLGFHAGDALLIAVGARLQAILRNTDLLVRMGGDEFALLLLGGAEYAGEVGRRVLEAFQEPFRLQNTEILSSACLGVSVYPDDAADEAELQAHADLAMFSAKDQGRGRIRFFGNAADHNELEQLELEAQLRHAVELGQMRAYYQPQYELLSGNLIGFEALLRWQHPTLGLLSPARFVPLAEQCGLILPLSAWILNTAVAQTARWNAGRGQPLRIAVNLSAAQLEREDLCRSVLQALSTNGLNAEYLELEITESQVMLHTPNLEAQMRDLRQIGVRFAVDDFGTGYSNLSRLSGLAINTLKVDRSFVSALGADHGDSGMLVKSIVQLAHNLKLDVLAEGVETLEQLERLHFVGCDLAQGYYFDAPLAAADAEKKL
jgi:diguanylate cyclase (GGDEF)-like protein